jgi:hypothetical protein
VGKLPWVLNDDQGRPIATFRTRAMRRLVAHYMRVVALGTLPGAGVTVTNPGDVIVGEYVYSRCRMNAEGRLRRIDPGVGINPCGGSCVSAGHCPGYVVKGK